MPRFQPVRTSVKCSQSSSTPPGPRWAEVEWMPTSWIFSCQHHWLVVAFFSHPFWKTIWRLRQLGSFPPPSITYALKYPSNKKVYYSIFWGNSYWYYSIDIPWVLCWIGNHINKLCVLGSLDVQDPSSTTKQNNCWCTAHISKVSMTFVYTIYLYQHLLPVNTSVPIYIRTFLEQHFPKKVPIIFKHPRLSQLFLKPSIHLHSRKQTCPLKIDGWFRCISYWHSPFKKGTC